jgi:pectate lyase
MKKLLKFIFLTLSLILFISVNAETPAFPTAEGYGKYAKGGRGGKVVFVENLEDYIAYNNLEAPIPGSFRWALTQYPGEPLTIIFRVSGTIVLKPYLILSGTTVKNQNDIRTSRANLTIAGQTAPGEGITIRNSKVNLGGCTDLIVRNVRFRIGETAYETPIYGYKVGGIAKDTLAPVGSFLPGGSVGCENALKVIFDHCVFGWSGEENITMYDNRYTTVQWSNMHEGLYDDGHGKGNRSYGGQCGGINATWHHNLFAHNYSRSPRLNGARTDNEVKVFIEFINNLNYNWGRSGAPYGGELYAGTVRSHTANFVGNYYKPGPGTDASRVFFNLTLTAGANKPQWHVKGNVMEGNTAMTSDNWTGFSVSYGSTGLVKSDIYSDTLLFPPLANVYNGSWIGYDPYKINIQTAIEAYQSVLDKVGTIKRDSVERRIIREVKNGLAIFKASQGKAGIIDKSFNAEGYLSSPAVEAPADNDRDGMADVWETQNGLNAADPEDRKKLTLSGYTALEVYLNSLMGEKIPLEFSSGIDEKKIADLSIFPTTFTNVITVNGANLKNATIFSMNGTKVLTHDLTQNQIISTENIKNGVYLMKIVDIRNNVAIYKVIKY